MSPALITKLITYWDLRVKQGGEIVTYRQRLDDRLARYGETCLVGHANMAAKPRLEVVNQEIESLLGGEDSRSGSAKASPSHRDRR